jgi:hypothetical protein
MGASLRSKRSKVDTGLKWRFTDKDDPQNIKKVQKVGGVLKVDG